MRDALDAIGQLPDVEIDIADAALQLARIDAPGADWKTARAHVSELARGAAALANGPAHADLDARVAALAELIVGRYGYTGDSETYDDPVNANLIRVTERRRGLPVALGILWLHCIRAAGWNAHGVDFPGHFLVALEGAQQHAVLDVFDGGTKLNAPALRTLLKRVQGIQAELRPGLLQPMSTRAVLLRLQNNVKARRLQNGDLRGALTTTLDMLRFAPDTSALWREAASMHQRLDEVAAALRCFEQFLKLVPQGEAATRARRTMDELRARLN